VAAAAAGSSAWPKLAELAMVATLSRLTLAVTRRPTWGIPVEELIIGSRYQPPLWAEVSLK
jgi:hypothetical protein